MLERRSLARCLATTPCSYIISLPPAAPPRAECSDGDGVGASLTLALTFPDAANENSKLLAERSTATRKKSQAKSVLCYPWKT